MAFRPQGLNRFNQFNMLFRQVTNLHGRLNCALLACFHGIDGIFNEFPSLKRD
jgi:hypothetical protein